MLFPVLFMLEFCQKEKWRIHESWEHVYLDGLEDQLVALQDILRDRIVMVLKRL